jgi:hypothetical protein
MTTAATQAKTPCETSPLQDLRLAGVTGELWGDLPLSVRNRFLKYVGDTDSVTYSGHVEATRRNLAGTLLAQLLRCIGAPLPLEARPGNHPAIVTITRHGATGGQVWTRAYSRTDGLPQVIHSVKTFAGPTGLEERIGAGFAMCLELTVERDALLFQSAGYRWRGLGLDLPLPAWLEPGHLTVGHHPDGDHAFRFTLDLVHPWFGELLHQTLYFHDMKEA